MLLYFDDFHLLIGTHWCEIFISTLLNRALVLIILSPFLIVPFFLFFFLYKEKKKLIFNYAYIINAPTKVFYSGNCKLEKGSYELICNAPDFKSLILDIYFFNDDYFNIHIKL
jgi:hypothetical protein